MFNCSRLCFLFGLLLAGLCLKAQEDTTHYKLAHIKGKPVIVITTDGAEFVGEIIGDTTSVININTLNGLSVQIPKKHVKSIHAVTPLNYYNGNYIGDNKFPQNYITGTNAFLYKKGSASINSYYLIGASFNYAINENVALGFNSSIIGSPLTLNIKANMVTPSKDHIGIEAQTGSFTYLIPGAYYGQAGVKYTRGNANKNITIGGGIFSFTYRQYASSKNHKKSNSYIVFSESTYYLNISGCTRISTNNAFVYEILSLPADKFILAGLGIRTVRKEKKSFVLGFYNFINLNGYPRPNNNNPIQNLPDVIPIPYLGLNFKL